LILNNCHIDQEQELEQEEVVEEEQEEKARPVLRGGSRSRG
jgi:hypothetical protein